MKSYNDMPKLCIHRLLHKVVVSKPVKHIRRKRILHFILYIEVARVARPARASTLIDMLLFQEAAKTLSNSHLKQNVNFEMCGGTH